MGYESKIYVVEKFNNSLDNTTDKKYAQVIATYDMCKFNGFDNIFKTETDCYIYADDGNTIILKDRYDEPLKETNIENVIKYLEKHKNTNYRRVNPLLNLLKGFNLKEWDNLTVLHYGY
jgi:hypothetical protein